MKFHSVSADRETSEERSRDASLEAVSFCEMLSKSRSFKDEVDFDEFLD